MKNSKKIVALVLAMVMIFALTASALAATDSTNSITVTVNFSKRTPSVTTGFTPQTVTLTKENPTVYDAIEALSKDSTNKKVKNAAWLDVPVTDANGNETGEIGKALVYITLERGSYNSQYVWTTIVENCGSNGSTTATPRSDGKYDCVYTGSDWIYYIGNVKQDDYMNRTVISDGAEIYVYYETTTETWIADKKPNS